MEELITWATDLIAEWGYLIIFLLAAADNLGLPSAGDVALLAGAAAAESRESLQWRYVVAAAFAGGLLADHLSYSIGRFGGGPIARRFLPDRFLSPIETRLHNNAGKTVTSARMIAGFRSGVPLISGVSRLPWRTFAVYNFIGVTIWAVGIGLLGLVFARSVDTVATVFDTGSKLVAVAIVSIIFIAVAVAVVRNRRGRSAALDSASGIASGPNSGRATLAGDPDGAVADTLEAITVREAGRIASTRARETRRERLEHLRSQYREVRESRERGGLERPPEDR